MRYALTDLRERARDGERAVPAILARVIDRVRDVLHGDDDGNRAQRTAALAFAVRIASAFILYASQVILARWLGGFEYGIYVFVWACVLIFGGISTLGFSVSVARFIPEYIARREHDLLRGIVRSSRVVPFLVSTGAAVVGAAIVALAPRLVASYYVIPLFLAFVCFPAYTLIGVQDGIARARGWILLALVPLYVLRPVLLLALMVGALVAGAPATAATAMYCAIGAVWLSALAQMLTIDRRLSATVEPGPRRNTVGFWIKVSLPICLADSFYLFITNTDILVLSLFRTPEETGVYFAAIKTLALISFVSFAVAAASAHKFSEYYASGEHGKLEAFVRQTIVWTFWPSLAGTVAILAMGRPILWLFGDGFTDAYPVMFVVAAGLLAQAAIGPLERLLNVTGHQGTCARIYFAAFLINLGLNLALIPSFGIMGAGIATGFAFIVESILLAVVVNRKLGLHVMIWHKAT